jgi:hypothetical protein
MKERCGQITLNFARKAASLGKSRPIARPAIGAKWICVHELIVYIKKATVARSLKVTRLVFLRRD